MGNNFDAAIVFFMSEIVVVGLSVATWLFISKRKWRR